MFDAALTGPVENAFGYPASDTRTTFYCRQRHVIGPTCWPNPITERNGPDLFDDLRTTVFKHALSLLRVFDDSINEYEVAALVECYSDFATSDAAQYVANNGCTPAVGELGGRIVAQEREDV